MSRLDLNLYAYRYCNDGSVEHIVTVMLCPALSSDRALKKNTAKSHAQLWTKKREEEWKGDSRAESPWETETQQAQKGEGNTSPNQCKLDANSTAQGSSIGVDSTATSSAMLSAKPRPDNASAKSSKKATKCKYCKARQKKGGNPLPAA